MNSICEKVKMRAPHYLVKVFLTPLPIRNRVITRGRQNWANVICERSLINEVCEVGWIIKTLLCSSSLRNAIYLVCGLKVCLIQSSRCRKTFP